MKKVLLFVLLLFLQERLICGHICTCRTDEFEQETISCCSSHQNHTCYSNFDEIVVESDIAILICAHHELSTELRLLNVFNVILAGYDPSGVSVTCKKGVNSGIQISGSQNIQIRNMQLVNCGRLHGSTSRIADTTQDKILTLNFTSSLHISDSVNITVQNVDILQGNGTGMVVLNSIGTITGCTFRENKVSDAELPGGGGLYVEFNSPLTEMAEFFDRKPFLKIYNSFFVGNEAVSLTSRRGTYVQCNSMSEFQGFGRGGGLVIYLIDNTRDVEVEIAGVNITSNSAVWGGGMYIHFCGFASDNTVDITDTHFSQNMCERFGGGGIDVGITPHEEIGNSSKNQLNFRGCSFDSNYAFFGGGASLYSAETTMDMENVVSFEDCNWTHNIAYYGSALDIAPQLVKTPQKGYLPVIILKDVTFVMNFIIRDQQSCSNDENVAHFNLRVGPGRGAFLVAGMRIIFEGSVTFSGNNGSAIYAVSTILEFTPASRATFESNQGLNGGAIALHGFSSLWMNDNTSVWMLNNSASLGGAIFHRSIDKHDYLFSHNCFVQSASRYGPKSGNTDSQVNFYFQGNRADSYVDTEHSNLSSHSGDSIYVTTLLPCFEYCQSESATFSCIGNFEFDTNHSVSTSGAFFRKHHQQPLNVIPGSKTKLPFNLYDDLNQSTGGLYHIDSDDPSSLVIDGFNSYTANAEIIMKGKPGTISAITVTKIGLREATVAFDVHLAYCPPFFKFCSESQKCVCAFNEEALFKNIHSCHFSNYTSSLLNGYWVGYVDGEKKADNFWYGICPNTYCFADKGHQRYHTLPSNEYLEKEVCGKKRLGVLCGKCGEGYCTYYHSPNFKCDDCQLATCRHGWILFIASELLPLTILFAVVMVFNINFTAGFLNGFIFHAQVFDSLFSIGKSLIYYPRPVYVAVRVVLVLYKLFNFDFFGEDKLAFCLWKDATTIQLLTFKFVTVFIAGALIVLAVLALKKCACTKLTVCCTTPPSMIHGLSAFLVMVYTQCTKVSFQLLNYSHIRSLNGTAKRVLFYQGNTVLFSYEHIPYAVVAIVCLVTLTTIPPLFLLSYPLCYKLSSVLRLDKTLLAQVAHKLLPVSKLKPIFDSFQGCFKDEYRFFAGLYFIYRVLLLATVLTSDPILTYTFAQFLLIAMLTVHCICWPYISRLHNVIDALILSNLTLINAITIFNYNYSQEASVYQTTIDISSYVLLLFVYAPLLYLIGYMLFSVCSYIWRRRKGNKNEVNEDDIILERLDEPDNEKELTNSYVALVDTY